MSGHCQPRDHRSSKVPYSCAFDDMCRVSMRTRITSQVKCRITVVHVICAMEVSSTVVLAQWHLMLACTLSSHAHSRLMHTLFKKKKSFWRAVAHTDAAEIATRFAQERDGNRAMSKAREGARDVERARACVCVCGGGAQRKGHTVKRAQRPGAATGYTERT